MQVSKQEWVKMDPALDMALLHQTNKNALDARNTSFSTVSVVIMTGKKFGVLPALIEPPPKSSCATVSTTVPLTRMCVTPNCGRGVFVSADSTDRFTGCQHQQMFNMRTTSIYLPTPHPHHNTGLIMQHAD